MWQLINSIWAPPAAPKLADKKEAEPQPVEAALDAAAVRRVRAAGQIRERVLGGDLVAVARRAVLALAAWFARVDGQVRRRHLRFSQLTKRRQ